ncbi:MAG: DUF4256 domain-containing protein [Myxococcales bacterium]|nr:DUF4256 domain-containing protein [Myxococcales bacterium]
MSRAPSRRPWYGVERPDEAKPVTNPDRTLLFKIVESRFQKHETRHPGIAWATVAARLEAASPAVLSALQAMEGTGGEPDVIGIDAESGRVVFCDCAAESPSGRRSLCFDEEALHARKEAKPAGSALGAAEAMGITLLNEEQYRSLQSLGEFDVKTSSWVGTPFDIRSLGGALFCDRRYGKVFVYHNGAQSYYAARGFRGRLLV